MENVGAPPPPPQQDRSSWPSSSLHAPGKHMRKPIHRRTVDYTSTVVRYIQTRAWQRDVRDSTIIQPTPVSVTDMLPSVAYPDNPSMSFCTKFVHASTNKVRCSINKVLWTPTGRRLITGSQSGEFTLWNGQAFNFEMILQAHDEAIRSMVWSHNENWMVTGDDAGCIKYWQTNMNNVKANKSAHKESVRDLSFSSTDLKFCSCSDDKNVKVWDFARCQEERSLAGHGWDVKSVDWHPQKSLLVSGAKDSLVKLWDAKTGRELCTLHGHKNTVLSVRWNSNGNWVLTSSKDQIIKIYDIRTLKEMESYRGHRKDVTCLAWHPFHEELFVSGSYDGAIIYWLVGHEFPQAEIQNAHENSVWDLAWHPMGHILCSGSNDHTTKFWCRNRPGEAVRENKGPPHLLGSSGEEAYFSGRPAVPLQANEGPTTPGAFVSGGPVRGEGNIPGVGIAMPFAQPVVDTAMMVDSSRPLPPPQQSVLNLVHSGGMIRGPHPPSAPHPSTLNNSSQPILYQQQLQLSLPQPQQQMMMQQPQPPLPPPRPIQPPLPPHPPPSVSNESNMSYPGMMPSSAPHMSGQIPFHGQPMLGVTSLHQGDYMQGPGGGMQVDMGGGQTFRTSGSGLQIQMPNLMGSLGLGSAAPYQAMPVPPMQQVSHTFQGSSMQGVMDNRGMMTNSGGLQMGLNVPRGPAPGQ